MSLRRRTSGNPMYCADRKQCMVICGVCVKRVELVSKCGIGCGGKIEGEGERKKNA